MLKQNKYSVLFCSDKQPPRHKQYTQH